MILNGKIRRRIVIAYFEKWKFWINLVYAKKRNMTVHFILSGETPEHIAGAIHLENPDYLIKFHNLHCARQDRITGDLRPGTRLLLPDAETVRTYNSRQDAPFRQPGLNPDIPFAPENFSKIYSITYNGTEDNGLEIKNTILSYTVSVKWIRSEGDSHVFHLFKNNFEEGQGSMMADLAAQSVRALNPLEVVTGPKGEITAVRLTQEISDQFNTIKARLHDRFPDRYAEIYIDEFARVVSDRDLFSRKMKDDVFIRTYFAAVRNPFINGKSALEQKIGEENVLLPVIQWVRDKDYSEEITLLQDTAAPEDNCGFSGQYILHTATGMVKEIEIRYHIRQFGIKEYGSFRIE